LRICKMLAYFDVFYQNIEKWSFWPFFLLKSHFWDKNGVSIGGLSPLRPPKSSILGRNHRISAIFDLKKRSKNGSKTWEGFWRGFGAPWELPSPKIAQKWLIFDNFGHSSLRNVLSKLTFWQKMVIFDHF
jgi:hypothetical protein